MRLANQTDPSTDGQLRVVGDHLGSATLVIDTSATPQVIHRQFYKPYGELALTSGSSRTSVGYTGQRLDNESALMFYGARFYDPVLSYFVSADNIAPDKSDPKTRNRYNYALNNPLSYNDPTGHCANEQDNEDKRACNRAAEHLRRFGFRINSDHWTVQELEWMIDAINELLRYMRKGAYSYEAFKDIMGIGANESVDLVNTAVDPRINSILKENCGAMCTDRDGGRLIGVNPGEFSEEYYRRGGSKADFELGFKYSFVHELAHLMDVRHGRMYSDGLNNYEITGCIARPLCAHEDSVSSYGQNCAPSGGSCPYQEQEDWAETVAAEVFPGYQLDVVGSKDPNNAPRHRAYARCKLGAGSCPPPVPPMTFGPSPYCPNINGCN
jgi:RHS repeat-associated protein